MVTPLWTLRLSQAIAEWIQEDHLLYQLFSMISPNIKIVSWNTQGAGSRDFLRSLKDLIRTHDPSILVLLETRLSGDRADKVCHAIGFDGVCRSKAIGFRGGIWILWRTSRVQLEEVDVHGQVVTKWLFSAIYASLAPQSREELWRRLLEFNNPEMFPWLLMGDFNETKNLEEPTGTSDEMRRRCSKFNSWIDEMCMMELGYSGARFTWSRGLDPETRTCARLDCGLCDLPWRSQFPDAAIRHLPAHQSDHSPLLLSLHGFENYKPTNKAF
ncbi:hypothetical protein V2J09_010086 [Rumex salicifolius]